MELPLPQPTLARPGTAEKIEVMRQRLAAGERLFHEDDPKIEWGRYTHGSDIVSVPEWDHAVAEALGGRSSVD